MSPANVTINDVARAAGVSKSLVSLTLNDRPGVKSETRERILQTAQELGWTPRPLEDSIAETGESLIEHGIVKV